jgi:hypothetical protein
VSGEWGRSEIAAFDPEDPRTWPLPDWAVSFRRPNGTIKLSDKGEAWFDGFDKALRMADHFHKTGRWDVTL